MLTALSIYCSVKVFFRKRSQEPCHRLNGEVNGHDLLVFDDLYVTSISMEKLIHSVIAPLVGQSPYFRERHRKLINQNEYIKAFDDFILEGVFVQFTLDLLRSGHLWKL